MSGVITSVRPTPLSWGSEAGSDGRREGGEKRRHLQQKFTIIRTLSKRVILAIVKPPPDRHL
jgi:hypothetical protein